MLHPTPHTLICLSLHAPRTRTHARSQPGARVLPLLITPYQNMHSPSPSSQSIQNQTKLRNTRHKQRESRSTRGRNGSTSNPPGPASQPATPPTPLVPRHASSIPTLPREKQPLCATHRERTHSLPHPKRRLRQNVLKSGDQYDGTINPTTRFGLVWSACGPVLIPMCYWLLSMAMGC